jgi:8-oxo-dGTP pyrophosphatase MutT (NUDIX family)
MSNWFAGAVVYKVERGQVYLLVQNSRSQDPRFRRQPVHVKFPGGTDDGCSSDISPKDTLRRELREETGLRYGEPDPKILCSLPPVREGELHRFFYLVPFEDCRGSLRHGEITDGRDLISSPRWVRADELGRELYKTHQRALLQTMRHFRLVG